MEGEIDKEGGKLSSNEGDGRRGLEMAMDESDGGQRGKMMDEGNGRRRWIDRWRRTKRIGES